MSHLFPILDLVLKFEVHQILCSSVTFLSMATPLFVVTKGGSRREGADGVNGASRRRGHLMPGTHCPPRLVLGFDSNIISPDADSFPRRGPSQGSASERYPCDSHSGALGPTQLEGQLERGTHDYNSSFGMRHNKSGGRR